LYTQLNGLNLPLQLGQLEAFVMPLPVNDSANAGAYVWGSHHDEVRKAFPRAENGDLSTGGLKELTWQLDVWLLWFGQSDETDVNLQFPSIVDFVCAVLRNAPLVQAADHARDPVTGQLSQLIAVGEKLSSTMPPPRATSEQGIWRYDAAITVEVIEEIQA
jgi:hypothetical protein